MIIRPEPLTKASFLPYGDVLETDGVSPEIINCGYTQKFANLANITIAEGGSPQTSIFRSREIAVPFRIRLLERHPLASQAFYPLHDRPFPVVVAATEGIPGVADIRVFLSNGRQGVNLRAGVWHHYQLSLGQESDYLVIDCGGAGENCQEHRLTEEIMLRL